MKWALISLILLLAGFQNVSSQNETADLDSSKSAHMTTITFTLNNSWDLGEMQHEHNNFTK